MDFTTLTGARETSGSIKNWGKHALIDAEGVLTESQAWIYNRLRDHEMQVEWRLSLNQNEDEIDLPVGFQEPIFLRVDGDRRDLPYWHENLARFRDSEGNVNTGRARGWTILGGKIQFDARLDDNYEATFAYYGTPAALAAGNPTNFLTIRYPSLLRKVCTAYAYEDRENWAGADAMFKRALAEMDDANVIAEGYRRGQRLRE